MPRKPRLGRVIAALGAVAIAAVASFAWDMKRAYDRVGAKGVVIPSVVGNIEYAEGGEGPAVLVIHGSGGGYDQGELIAHAVLGDDFHWIAPSRFGYLRSTLVPGSSWDDQARAYAALLDHLEVDRVAVLAMSQGGPSGLLFALLHPNRVSSLTLLSCGVTASTSADQADANDKGDLLTTIFQHDMLYWAVSKLAKKQLLELLGADDAVIGGLTDEQRSLLDDFVDGMNPASLRAAGVSFDNKATMPGARIAAISAPTLIVHAEDDRLQLFHNATFAANTIPDAKLLRFARGGHLVIGIEQAKIRSAVKHHIQSHLPPSTPGPQ